MAEAIRATKVEETANRRAAPSATVAAPATSAVPAGLNGYLLALQGAAGNAAVQRLVAPPSAPPADPGPQGQQATQGQSEQEGPAAGPRADDGDTLDIVVPDPIAEHADAIDADTATSIGAVRAASQQRRAQLTASAAQVAGGVDAGFGGAIGRVGSAVDGTIARVGSWLRGTAGSAIGLVTNLAAGAAGFAADAAGRVRAGAAAARTAVESTVGSVASGVLGFARGLPIPNLPGVGRVRSWILGAAERVSGSIRSAIGQVTGFVASIVSETAGLVERAARAAQGAIRRIGESLRSLIDRGIAAITSALRQVVQTVTGALRSAWTAAKSAAHDLFGTSVGHIAAAEQQAVARIEANRADGHANLDVGPDPATDVEEVALVRAENAATVQQAQSVQGGVVAATLASAGEYLGRIRAGVAAVGQRILQIGADVFAQAREAVTAVVRQALDVVRGYASRVADALRDIASTVLGLVRAPITALADVGRSVLDGTRTLLRSVLGRIRQLVSGGPISGDDTAVTAPLQEFTTSRLRSAAQMASPPAAAAAIAIPIFVGVELAAILWWLGIALLVIAVIVLLYLLIRELMKARPRPIPRERPRDRARRRRKRTPKPFRWNLRFLGGILDWNGKLDPGPQPIHGHHSWPKYVGGAPEQPLMDVRHDIHLHVIHPELHAAMATFAASKGFPIVENAFAAAFIAHLRTNPGDKATFIGVMTAYYLLLHSQTDPGIPPSAYGSGIAYSAARL